MAFHDYVQRLGEKAPHLKDGYRKFGIALFKAGFTYEDTEFVALPDEGGIYEVYYPDFRKDDDVKSGTIRLHHYRWTKGVKYEYTKWFTIHQVENWKSDEIKKTMYAGAQEVS